MEDLFTVVSFVLTTPFLLSRYYRSVDSYLILTLPSSKGEGSRYAFLNVPTSFSVFVFEKEGGKGDLY